MKNKYILSMVAFMLLAVNYVSAAETKIYPTMDTYIHQGTGGQNGTKWNTETPNIIEVRYSTGTLNRISFIDFPVSTITTPVTSAILNLYLSHNANNVAGPETVQVYQVTSQAVTIDNDATWNSIYPGGTASYTLGSLLTSQSVSNISADNNKQYSFDITSLINSIAPGTTKITLCLKAATNAAPIDFWSVNYATEALRPNLVVTNTAVASTNYVLNPSFEADNAAVQQPMNWSEWSPNGTTANASVVAGDAHSGSYYGKMAGAADYNTMTYQSISGLPTGTYTLSGWFRSSGGQGWGNMSIKNYGGPELYTAINSAMATWTKKTISNIEITTGVCEIDIYNPALAGQWTDYDDIELTLNSSGGTTATTLQAASKNISVYPTVITNNVLSISNATNGDFKVSISNLSGQLFYSNEFNKQNVTINTTFLKSGMYLVRVGNGIENQTVKVIIR